MRKFFDWAMLFVLLLGVTLVSVTFVQSGTNNQRFEWFLGVSCGALFMWFGRFLWGRRNNGR